SRTSRMIRVEPGPIPGIFGRVRSGPTRSVSGVSRARTTAAARLYPNILCRDACPKARSRTSPLTTPFPARWIRGTCTAIAPSSRHARAARLLLEPGEEPPLDAFVVLGPRWRVGFGGEDIAVRECIQPARMVEPSGKCLDGRWM